MKFLHDKFRDIRKEKHIAINYIASSLNISRRTLWTWESGNYVPDEKNVRALAKLVGVSVSLISDLQEEMPFSSLSLKEIITKEMKKPSSESESSKLFTNLISTLISLKEKEQQSSSVIKALLQSLNAMLYIKDVKLKYITVNDAFLNNLSLPMDFSFIGKNDNDFYSQAEAEENTEEDEQVLTTGRSIINREGIIPGTRKSKWGLISKCPVFDSNQRVFGVVGTFVDITERKKNEKRRELLEKAMDNIEECVVYVDTKRVFGKGKTEIKYMNNTIEKLTGIKKDEYIKDPRVFRKFIHPDYIKAVDEFIKNNKYPKSVDYKITARNGKELLISEKQYKDGDIYFGIGYFRGLSD